MTLTPAKCDTLSLVTLGLPLQGLEFEAYLYWTMTRHSTARIYANVNEKLGSAWYDYGEYIEKGCAGGER